MASSPASTARPMATSESSSRLARVAVRLERADARPQRERRADARPAPPARPRRAARRGARPTRPSGRRAGCCSARGTSAAGSRGRRAARCRRSRRAAHRRGRVDEPVDHPGQVVVGGHLHRVRRRSATRTAPSPSADSSGGEHPGQRVGRRRPLLRRHEQRPALGDVEQALGAVVHELGGDRRAVAVGVVGQAPQPREVRVVGRGDLAGVGARRPGRRPPPTRR